MRSLRYSLKTVSTLLNAEQLFLNSRACTKMSLEPNSDPRQATGLSVMARSE